MRALILRGAIFGVLALAAVAACAQSPYQLAIVSPAEDATVFDNNGDAVVKASVEPPLAQGDRLELLVDGSPAAPPGSSLEFPLEGLVRGEHLVQARVIDATGNVAAVSPSSTFYVWEASRLFPTRHR